MLHLRVLRQLRSHGLWRWPCAGVCTVEEFGGWIHSWEEDGEPEGAASVGDNRIALHLLSHLPALPHAPCYDVLLHFTLLHASCNGPIGIPAFSAAPFNLFSLACMSVCWGEAGSTCFDLAWRLCACASSICPTANLCGLYILALALFCVKQCTQLTSD